jgi:uroporphyrinogen decarboxylase
MTSVERMAALMEGKPIDRIPFVPFIFGFAARNTGIPLDIFYSNPEKSFWASKMTKDQYCYDGAPGLGYADYGAWEFGGEVKLPKARCEQTLIVTSRPADSEEQAWKLKLPDVKSAGFLPILMEFSKVQERNGVPISCTGGEPFSTAVSVAGVENFCHWMIKKPKLCHHLLRLATEHRVQVIHHWLDTFGVERVGVRTFTTTETNYIISPKQFEEFVLPYTKELHERILAMGVKSIYCHICGEHNLNLPHWEKIPFGNPGMVSIGSEMEIETAIKHFGEKCIIFGNIAPTLLLTGTAYQIYEECRKCIERGKKAPRGYVLMAGCEVPVDTPPLNLWIMRKAIADFGFYK